MANTNAPKRLAEDDLVAKLVPNPGAPPNVRLISGWLGESARSGYWRLYVTPELTRYVEFEESAIHHYQRLNSTDAPLGGTLLWVDRETTLVETRTCVREAQGRFLDGDLTAMLRDPQVTPFLDLTGIPGGVQATTVLCFTFGVALGGAGMIAVSQWQGTCAKLRSYITNC